MSVLWWLVGIVLIVLSFLLLAAGFQGREGILRIGKVTEAESEEGVPQRPPRSTNAWNVAVGIVGVLVGIAAVLLFGV